MYLGHCQIVTTGLVIDGKIQAAAEQVLVDVGDHSGQEQGAVPGGIPLVRRDRMRRNDARQLDVDLDGGILQGKT